MFVGKEAVGYYGAASRVFTILLTVAQSLNQAVLPTVLQAVKRLNPLDITKAGMVLYLNLALGLALGAGTWLGAPLITALLFGEEFTATTGILRVFALTIAVWPLMMYLGTLMIARGHYEDFLKMTIISLATAVTADLTLIPRLQLTGAALVLPVAALATIITGLSIIRKAARRGEFPGKAVFAPASVARGFRRWREEKRRGK
jgi:O-antigen/teichoic acid export membrane protein